MGQGEGGQVDVDDGKLTFGQVQGILPFLCQQLGPEAPFQRIFLEGVERHGQVIVAA